MNVTFDISVNLFIQRNRTVRFQIHRQFVHLDSYFFGSLKELFRNNPVKYESVRRGILRIHTEISLAHKLETVIRFDILEIRLHIALPDFQRVRIQIQRTILLIVNAFFLVDQIS